jgi:hypothetical protein
MKMDPSNADYLIVSYGNADPADTRLLSTVRATDDEIMEYLKRREARQARRKP